MLLCAATYGGRDFIVFMLNCGGTKVDDIINVFSAAQHLADFSLPVLTAFQGRTLKLAPLLLSKTLSALIPCFSSAHLNTAWIVIS